MPLIACRIQTLLRSLTLATTIVALPGTTAFAQNAFTYQGQLKSSGAPFSGTADVRFTLYDAATDGNVIAAPYTAISLAIVDGLISTELDFGALAFDGSPRWLEIEVTAPSTAGAGPFQALSPRQPVTPAPYAMFALNAATPFAYDGPNAVFDEAGNVGIGTTAPGHKFVVQTSTNNYGVVHSDGTTSMGTYVGSGAGWLGTITGNNLNFFTANGPARMTVDTAGNVGVGNTSPLYKFDVNSSNGIRLSMAANGGGSLILANNFGDNRIYLEGFNSTNNGSATEMLLTGYAGGFIPQITLRSSFTVAEGPFRATGTAGQWAIHGSSSGTDGFAVVGISTGLNGRGIEGQCAANGLGATIGVHGTGNYGILGTQNEGVVGIGVGGDHGVSGVAVAGTQSGGLYGRSDASNGNGLVAEANIGTAAYGVWGRATQGIGGFFTGGQYAIVAQGKAKVNTIEIIGGSDLAEPFDVAQVDDEGSLRDIEPGMVVVIDPANPGALMISTAANDRKVAGIISGANDLAPGMIMKSEGGMHVDGDHPVALTGRVWCWCDASTASIEPGDMLTTSDTAGHAMKVGDLWAAQGAIIGKAMTPLAAGDKGLVLVLVNLQ